MYDTVVVGMKLLKETSAKKMSLEDLETQYRQQLEYVEYLRKIIRDMTGVSGIDTQLQQKKAEMESLKANLEALQMMIVKMKIK